jgi:hypothetical protein
VAGGRRSGAAIAQKAGPKNRQAGRRCGQPAEPALSRSGRTAGGFRSSIRPRGIRARDSGSTATRRTARVPAAAMPPEIRHGCSTAAVALSQFGAAPPCRVAGKSQ